MDTINGMRYKKLHNSEA